jgi:hypothetical protein
MSKKKISPGVPPPAAPDPRSQSVPDMICGLLQGGGQPALDRALKMDIAQFAENWGYFIRLLTPSQFDQHINSVRSLLGLEPLRTTGAAFRDMVKDLEAKVKSRFTPKPRCTARDAEVVRLRDEDKLTWKEILRRIRDNETWTMSGNKPVTRRALQAAYGRRKKLRTFTRHDQHVADALDQAGI